MLVRIGVWILKSHDIFKEKRLVTGFAGHYDILGRIRVHLPKRAKPSYVNTTIDHTRTMDDFHLCYLYRFLSSDNGPDEEN